MELKTTTLSGRADFSLWLTGICGLAACKKVVLRSLADGSSSLLQCLHLAWGSPQLQYCLEPSSRLLLVLFSHDKVDTVVGSKMLLVLFPHHELLIAVKEGSQRLLVLLPLGEEVAAEEDVVLAA
ncbi:hypothetical protein MTO96_028262 [Rhipicephalus appendiculatus]